MPYLTKPVACVGAVVLVATLFCWRPWAAVSAAPTSINVSISPVFSTLETSGSQNFTATVRNDAQNKGVNWTVSGIDCSSVVCGTFSALASASGTPVTFTAPSSLPTSNVLTVTATSVADPRRSAAAIIVVTSAALSVSVTPSAPSVEVGNKLTVTAAVSNNEGNRGVTWRIDGPGCGGLSCGRVSSRYSKPGTAITYTAPENLPSPATVTIRAISVADFTKSAATTIALTQAPGEIVATASSLAASVPAGSSENFVATLINDAQNQGLTWQLLGAPCSENQCGSLSSTSSGSGEAIMYTAPEVRPTPASITLRATSVTDTTKSVAITITIM